MNERIGINERTTKAIRQNTGSTGVKRGYEISDDQGGMKHKRSGYLEEAHIGQWPTVLRLKDMEMDSGNAGEMEEKTKEASRCSR